VFVAHRGASLRQTRRFACRQSSPLAGVAVAAPARARSASLVNARPPPTEPGSAPGSAPGWSADEASATQDEHATVVGSDPVRFGPDSGDELAPGTAVGRYTILSRIGAGAMGVVYAAYDPDLDRKVALKLLHPRSTSVDSSLRLMREAKALARLSHPNVVAVHDVGTYAGRVFLAMEFVDGKTLAAWLKEAPRPWQAVVAIMREAGAGLAAAHDAGLIHRDFKPDNVLIARDGRVRVLDFGLARTAADSPGDEPDPAAAALISSIHSSRRTASEELEAALMTRTGALVGTPAYMSPEQHLGRAADPRSDQFAYCVTFYQALYGQRPFVAEKISALAFQVLQGKVGAAPTGAAVPAWLRKTILRGLQVEPGARHPNMRALLAALSRERGVARWSWLAGAGLALAAGGWLALRPAGPVLEPPCRGAAARLAGVWDEPRTAALERVFLASGLPYAGDTWRSLRGALQARADEWARVYTDACEATAVRHEQSDELLDLRMRCLERRRLELRALGDVLLGGESTAIEQAAEGAARLGDLGECSDAAALRAVVPPPAGAQQRAEVDRIAADVVRASALELAGKWNDALALAAAAVAAADAAAYPPLAAEALRVHAGVQHRLGDVPAAIASLRAAADAAGRGRDDRAAAEAFIDLVLVVGFDLTDAAGADAYAQAAAAWVQRAGGDALQRARLDANMSAALGRLGRLGEALARGKRALAVYKTDPRADPPRLQRLLCTLALVYKARGELAAARSAFEEALEIVRRVSGPDHPGAATLLTNLGDLALDEGAVGEARERADQAAAIRRRALPAGHVDHADTEQLFARIAEEQQDLPAAAAHYRRALEIYAVTPAASRAKLAALRNNAASLAHAEGRLADAIPDYRAALDDFRAALGDDSSYVRTVEANLAEALVAADDPAAALPLQTRVVAALEREHGPDHPEPAAARVLLAAIHRALGRPLDALPLLERDLPRLDPADPVRVALARWTLARTLADLQRDRPRQRQLAAAAEPVLAVADDPLARRALAELRARPRR
jgi:tRNA A-37 threonylcarbamoyl transferase component Bud32